MALAILCSGQGRQHPGHVRPDRRRAGSRGPVCACGDIARRHAIPAISSGPKPTKPCISNRVGQLLCTLQALAAAAALRDATARPLIVAGYSVGEVAAWGVAGLLSATDTLDLVARRAEAMDAATHPGDGLCSFAGSPATTSTGCASATRPRSPSSIPAMLSSSAEAARRCRRSRTKRRRCTPQGLSICRSRLPPIPDGSPAPLQRFGRVLRLISADVPAGCRHAHPERHRRRSGHLGRGRARQAGRADIANGAVGKLPARLHRSGRHGLSGTRTGACVERNGSGSLARRSDAIAGRFQDPSGRPRLAGASRQQLTRTQ